MRQFILLIFLLLGMSEALVAQSIAPHLLSNSWSANWITVPDASPNGYGVYMFRKKIALPQRPQSFVVHISADNRFKLFVNEKWVALGPARGDLYHWNYETLDLAPYLNAGENILSAIVWNEGELRPEGQISSRTSFVLQGNTAAAEIANTNSTWKCLKNTAYTPLRGIGYTGVYYVSGPGEWIDMQAMPQDWQSQDFNDRSWQDASNATWSKPAPKGLADNLGWMLVPSPLPQMEMTPQRFAALRKSEGLAVPSTFPQSKTVLTIPARSTVVLLLDQAYLTNAYPVLQFSKGLNASLSLIYAESLFYEVPNGRDKVFRKGNRNEVEGKFIAGRKDSLRSNGLDKQEFTTLNYRTFRYVQLRISTADAPLIIDDFYSLYTGYPFELKATFDAQDQTLNQIFAIGWRTARACAMDTYMDCPYYEQLQYIGDTRIQALVTLYHSNDDRLLRNAINQMDQSRIAEGITLSRHPSFTPQQIPTFSLWYIGMLHDYWMYRGDSAFIRDKLMGLRGILDFFSKYQQADGSLRKVPYWNFTDWRKLDPNWKKGIGPLGADGSSSILDLQLLWAYQLAADLEKQLGMPSLSEVYTVKASQLAQTIQVAYWDEGKKVFADNKDKKNYSQHANTLAILTEVVKGQAATELARKILRDTSLVSTSIYFKYYVHQALVKAGLGDDYLNWLGIWRENIKQGLSTWAELSNIDNSRSDCHAWGASPNIELLRTVLGIDAAAPGFAKVKIEPHLGLLTSAKGSVPHPHGSIEVDYQLIAGQYKIAITLPAQVSGTFIWKNKTYSLKPGKNNLGL